jgi:AraC-like DNA-binding protein
MRGSLRRIVRDGDRSDADDAIESFWFRKPTEASTSSARGPAMLRDDTFIASKDNTGNRDFVGAGAPGDLDVQTAVVRLLANASGYLERDQLAAKRCINRAASLLESLAPMRGRTGKDSPSRLVSGGLAPWQIHRLKAHVEANLAATIAIEQMAELCRLSVSHFARAFKASFGEPPHRYVVRQRIARAREMMLATDEPLSRVALDCGFADQSHFSRLFRRQEGESPNAWRRARGAVPDAVKPVEQAPREGAPAHFRRLTARPMTPALRRARPTTSSRG